MPHPIPAERCAAGYAKSSGGILLVEDNDFMRCCISEFLVRAGYQVTAVDSGQGFYRALAESSFSLALIDLGLPDVDGLQLVKFVRLNTALRCIVLTGRDSVEARISGYRSGADLYMTKPVDCRELVQAISNMMRRSAAEAPVKTSENRWHLNRQSASLVSPASLVVSLTAREMDFLLCLAASAEETAARDAILVSMGYANDAFSNRALESLIRRLRRKIESVCGTAPIMTRRGAGYSFSAPLAVD